MSECLVLSAPVSITDSVRELVTAPKLRICPHRVAVVLTTCVTGNLRLLRILASTRRPGAGRRRHWLPHALSAETNCAPKPAHWPRTVAQGIEVSKQRRILESVASNNDPNPWAGIGERTCLPAQAEPIAKDSSRSTR